MATPACGFVGGSVKANVRAKPSATPNPSYMDSPTKARNWPIVWLRGKRLQSYIRHLRWDRMCPVPTWNLRHRSASRYKRQASCRKSYRRLSVWG